MTDTSCSELQLINSDIDTAITIGGDRCMISNCKLAGGVTVSSTAFDTGISNSYIGSTVTISASATRTRVIGCATDTSISDSGTGSSLV